MLALLVDWAAATFVVVAILGSAGWSEDPWSGFLTLAIYWAEASLFTSLIGGSFGQVLTRLRVVRYQDLGPVDLVRSALRHLLVCLVVPPLVFKPDGRGLHDLAVGSVAVPLDVVRNRQRRQP